jgi:drug/metabolite transporter (DMT)-like permease
VLYAVIVLGAGFIFFHETFTLLQYIGLTLALIGVVLINLPF